MKNFKVFEFYKQFCLTKYLSKVIFDFLKLFLKIFKSRYEKKLMKRFWHEAL